jgi:hypothetical protein
VRQFGVHRYTETPKAVPPTLTIYAGSALIDLNALEVPAGVEVLADAPDYYRKAREGDAALKAIDDFVAKHKARAATTTGERR